MIVIEHNDTLVKYAIPMRERAASSPIDLSCSYGENEKEEQASLAKESLAATSTTHSIDSLSAFTDPSGGTLARAQSTISFPESVELFRESARKSRNPVAQFDYAMYLFDSARKIIDDPALLQIPLPEDESPETRNERLEKMRSVLEAEGIKWLKRLATHPSGPRRQPLAEAQFVLAEYYGKGLYSLPVDHSKAFYLYIQASKQNHPTATFRAAACYELGAGTKQDQARAAQFYRKAAALGDRLAMHKLALIMLYGKLGQRRNLKEGITWLKRAASVSDAEHPESLYDLAQCFERDGGCPIVLPDESYAFDLYCKAASFGFAPAQYRVGSCYEFGLLSIAADHASSIHWYSKAAEQGYPEAEVALAHWYLSGAESILNQSDEDAYKWARKAADRGHPKAEYTVGHFYEVGIGVNSDINEAKKWYTLAASKGSKKAIIRLAELKRQQNKNSRSTFKCVIS